ncbi:MAG: hypothetical protein J0H15_04985 [Xanthomonadales bacterium]|nr:hypothetical protein [Xanthomonadales bacterium]
MTRDLKRRIDRLEGEAGGDPPKTSLLCRLTADRQVFERHDGLTVTRMPDEPDASFWHRAAVAFGVDEVIGLVGVRPEDVKRGPDGRIDAASLPSEALAELLEARRCAQPTT